MATPPPQQKAAAEIEPTPDIAEPPAITNLSEWKITLPEVEEESVDPAAAAATSRRNALREKLRAMQIEESGNSSFIESEESKRQAEAAAVSTPTQDNKEEILISTLEEKTSDEAPPQPEENADELSELERKKYAAIYYKIDENVVKGKDFSVTAISGNAEKPSLMLQTIESVDLSYLAPYREGQSALDGMTSMKACLLADEKAFTIARPCITYNAPIGKPFIWKWTATPLKDGVQDVSVKTFFMIDGEDVPAGERTVALRTATDDYLGWKQDAGGLKEKIVAFLTDFETIIVTAFILLAMMLLWIFKPRRKKNRLYQRDEFQP